MDRLSSLDVSFLYMEEPTTAMHVGGLAIFEAPPDRPFDHDVLLDLIEQRIALVPRYRQKVRWIPGHLGNPVWVDDPDFDVSYHVRRSALPKPGTQEQLLELVGRLQSRQLDRARPLWEMYLVEGLEGGRSAVITKTHHAMVDGVSAVDIGSVILDLTPTPRETPPDDWDPKPEPSSANLLLDVVAEWVRQPAAIIDTVRGTAADLRATATKVGATLGGLASALRVQARPAPASPLNVTIGEQRRFGIASTDLDDYKRVRKAHEGTVNDVVLATVSGALRAWMLTRGEPVTPATTLRAMVPVSVRPEDQQGAGGNHVSSYFVDLPIGEPSAVMRLHQISYAMRAHKESGQSVAADAIVAMAGFAPPNLHALGARLGSGLSRRLFNVVVTNVPGPQLPLYAAGAKMLAMYPVVPLSKGQGVSIGLTSYDGGVYYGLNADRDAMPDVDVLAACIEDALAELVSTVD